MERLLNNRLGPDTSGVAHHDVLHPGKAYAKIGTIFYKGGLKWRVSLLLIIQIFFIKAIRLINNYGKESVSFSYPKNQSSQESQR